MIESAVEEAVAGLSEGPADEADWSAALTAVAAATNAKGAAIIPLARHLTIRAHTPALDALADAYNAHWHRHDFRLASVPKMLATGIAVDADIVSDDGMARLPYYTDFLAGHGVKWFAGIPFRDGRDVWCLTLQRTPGQGPFAQEEQQLLRKLGCRLSQSVSLARRTAAAHRDGVLDGLEAQRQPAFLLDGAGCFLRANAAMSGALRRAIGLDAAGSFPAGSAVAHELARRVPAILSPRVAVDDPARLPIVVPRGDRQPIAIRLRVIPGDSACLFEKAVVLALVDDLDDYEPASPDLLIGMFGLTRREAHVAASIGAGLSIAVCASELQVGIETVRSTLAKVFLKTGVNRQSELVHIVSRLRV